MKQRVRGLSAVLTCFALSAALQAHSARAQSLWMPRDMDRCIQVEFLEPGLELIKEDFPTAAVFLGGRFACGSGISVVGEIPFARVSGDYDLYISTSHASQSAVGNPYVGVEVGHDGSPIFGEFGIRLPMFNGHNYHAAIPGSYSDATRWDGFIDHHLSVHAIFNLREVSARGILTRLRFGPALLIQTGSYLGEEVYAIYAWEIGYERRGIRFGTAIAGRTQITRGTGTLGPFGYFGPPGNLGTRSTNQFELHADFGASTLRPGVDFKLPLGSAASLVPSVLGASLGIAFP